MQHSIAATQTINSLRSLLQVHPGEKIKVYYRRMRSDLLAEVQSWANYSAILCKASKFVESVPEAGESGRTQVFQPLEWGEFGIEVPAGSDLGKLRSSLEKKHSELLKHLEQTLKRLKNPDFIAKADPDLRQEMEDRVDNLTAQSKLLGGQINLLEQAA